MANAMHLKSLQTSYDAHVEEQELERVLHLNSMRIDKELHYGEMSHQIEIARREANGNAVQIVGGDRVR